MPEDNTAGIVLVRAKTQGLVMSRVPKQTRELFMKIAEEEFADDYGLLLKFLLDEFINKRVLESLDIKLSYVISLLEKSKEEIKAFEPKKRRMLNGAEKIIGKGGNAENEQNK